jgi:hypothetical protein
VATSAILDGVSKVLAVQIIAVIDPWPGRSKAIGPRRKGIGPSQLLTKHEEEPNAAQSQLRVGCVESSRPTEMAA